MKFTSIFLASGLLMAATVKTAPVSETNVPSASISIVDTTSPAFPSPITNTTSAVSPSPIVDPMNGAAATASITVTGKDVTAQDSGAESTMIGTAIALPVAIVAAIFLM